MASHSRTLTAITVGHKPTAITEKTRRSTDTTPKIRTSIPLTVITATRILTRSMVTTARPILSSYTDTVTVTTVMKHNPRRPVGKDTATDSTRLLPIQSLGQSVTTPKKLRFTTWAKATRPRRPATANRNHN